MENQSFAKLPTTEVIELCQSTIDKIYAKRNSNNASQIKAYIAHDLKWKKRWAKLFRFTPKPMTEEKAKKDLLSDTWSRYPSIYAYQSLEVAECLLSLAKKALAKNVSEISVTAEDFRHIHCHKSERL